MRIGYNTNGFAHHDLSDAIELLAELGYQSLAITLDHHSLNPYSAGWQLQLAQIRSQLARHQLTSVIETGARYLLNPRIKHEPTLISRDEEARLHRVDFLCRAIDIAAELESDCMSCWSGIVGDGASEDEVWDRLVAGLETVLEHANRRNVMIGFEPEPGMFIDRMARYEELTARCNSSGLQLTLDIGHLHCMGETPIADQICKWGGKLVNVHIEDMCAGRHEHLMFGRGEIDFGPVFAAFRSINYQKGLNVELSRHSHQAPLAAAEAMRFLRPFVEGF